MNNMKKLKLISLFDDQWEKISQFCQEQRIVIPKTNLDWKRYINSSKVIKSIDFNNIIKHRSHKAIMRLAHMCLRHVGLELKMVKESDDNYSLSIKPIPSILKRDIIVNYFLEQEEIYNKLSKERKQEFDTIEDLDVLDERTSKLKELIAQEESKKKIK